MSYKLSQSIVFVGMMGAGKTAIGRALAEELAVPFVDSDDAIEQAANLSISEIFAKFGEAFFREKEMQVVRRLVNENAQVIATGGGAYCQAETRSIINHQSISVWLNADLETIWNRVKGKNHRPLLQVENPKEVLATMLTTRLPDYRKAQLEIEVNAESSIEETRDLVLRKLIDQNLVKGIQA